jgi:CopA family copper-resistance protein
MLGAIVIEPAAGESIRADRDYVVVLSDWTDEDPMVLMNKLRKQSDYYNFNEPTAVDFFRDVAELGVGAALDKRRMWNRMRMSPAELADVSGYTYTYLMNGATPAANWTGLFRRGERVRLRFINAGAMSFFDVRIPGLEMTVVQADGQDVEPVTVDEFRIGVAETYDVIVRPNDDRAYTIFAQAMDRTGFARGILAPRAGMSAEVPALDPPVPLAMVDMMGSMSHGDSAVMDHSGHGMHAGMAMEAAPPRVRHASTEYGPGVDMRVDTPRTNLDDPGVGLRDNGRRVLTYADLHTRGGPLDPRAAQRDIELHLTGNMARYTWSIDGLEFGRSTPVHFRHRERLRVILHNDTMMTHPMHLHGMWSELENPDGGFQVRKHTINVQPAQRVSFLVSADALGRWAWHCHLLYHMDAGMFRQVVVA